jgi:ubiquinone/menaquinone biosynthesis C-methylase UbiE
MEPEVVGLSLEKARVKKLLESARQNAEKDRLREAARKLQEARRIAAKTKNSGLKKQVQAQAAEIFGKHRYMTEMKTIIMKPVKTDGLILDVGGGGEGIMGKLNGKQVVSIDTSEEELEGTKNESLKVVMDATNLKFLPESFDVCTAFFSLMYVPRRNHLKVFSQIHRVLKDGGRFLLWDVKIPDRNKDFRVFAVRLKIKLPSEEVETGYGTIWDKTQDMDYFSQLAVKAGFKVAAKWSRNDVFFLEMIKERDCL